jgi:hypothetical protein
VAEAGGGVHADLLKGGVDETEFHGLVMIRIAGLRERGLLGGGGLATAFAEFAGGVCIRYAAGGRCGWRLGRREFDWC